MEHKSYNIANAVAVLQATQTFKRIASWCCAQLNVLKNLRKKNG